MGSSPENLCGILGGNNYINIDKKNLPSDAFNGVVDGYFTTGCKKSIYHSGSSGGGWEYVEWGDTVNYDAAISFALNGESNGTVFMKNLTSSLHLSGWGNKPIDIRPAFFTINYIMKT